MFRLVLTKYHWNGSALERLFNLMLNSPRLLAASCLLFFVVD